MNEKQLAALKALEASGRKALAHANQDHPERPHHKTMAALVSMGLATPVEGGYKISKAGVAELARVRA